MERPLHLSMKQTKCLRKRKCADGAVMLASCREMVPHQNTPKHQAAAPDREVTDTAISGFLIVERHESHQRNWVFFLHCKDDCDHHRLS